MSQLNFLDGEEHSASPIRRQYLDIKRRYPDAILLFRLGDFYETFDEDAYLVSSELEIALTGRDMGRGERVPLAGIPCHAAEGYIARLLAKGHKIALAEQLGTPGRGLMAREVVRVITPGTLIEDSLLPARANNYLASVVPSREGAGLSLVDISTGEFAVTEIGADGWRIQLAAELERTRPAEILLPRSCGEDPTLAAVLPSGSCVTLREDSTFSSSTCERLLRDLFGVATLDGFGIGSNSLAARAAGSLISYLQETQPASLSQLENLHSYSLDRYMKLDPAARRHLELTANASTGGVEGSLLWVLDRTRTPMGGRLLRRWIGQPLLDLSAIEARLNSVEELVRAPLARAELADAMSGMGDLERLASRAAQQNLSPRDCLAMARSLRAVSRLRRTIERLLPALGDAESGGLDPCTEVAAAIESTVADDPSAQVGQGAIRQGRSRELDELKTQFFANVSHELRTPLTLILGPLSQRLADPGLESGLRADLERMARNAQVLLGHVNDLLDVARVDAGRMALRASELDLAGRRAINALEGQHDKNLAKYTDPNSAQYHAMVEWIAKQLNLTTLRYQLLDDLVEAIGLPREKLCTFCWTGRDQSEQFSGVISRIDAR